MAYYNTYQKHLGFTLLEVIIAVFLFSGIVALVAGFAVFYFRNYSFTYEEQQVVGESQAALTQIIRDIRRIRVGEDGAWPIVAADDNSFIFYSDINGDSKTDRIRYFRDGTNLQRGIIIPTSFPPSYPIAQETITTLISSLEATSTPLFRYYDGNWPASTTNNPLPANLRILNTRLVTVYMRINPTPNFAASAFDLSSSVTIRSMKTNF